MSPAELFSEIPQQGITEGVEFENLKFKINFFMFCTNETKFESQFPYNLTPKKSI